MDAKLFNLLLVQMIKEETIVQEENTVRLAAHSVSLGVDQADLRDKILRTYQESGLQPPFFRDIHQKLNVDPAQASDMYSNNAIGAVYDGLMQYAYLKRPYEVEPCLADGWPEVSPEPAPRRKR